MSSRERHTYCALAALFGTVAILISNPMWNDETQDGQAVIFIAGFLMLFALWEFSVWITRGWLIRDWPRADGDDSDKRRDDDRAS